MHLVKALVKVSQDANLEEDELEDEEESDELELLLLLELLAESGSSAFLACSVTSTRSCLFSLSVCSHLALNLGRPLLA